MSELMIGVIILLPLSFSLTVKLFFDKLKLLEGEVDRKIDRAVHEKEVKAVDDRLDRMEQLLDRLDKRQVDSSRQTKGGTNHGQSK